MAVLCLVLHTYLGFLLITTKKWLVTTIYVFGVYFCVMLARKRLFGILFALSSFSWRMWRRKRREGGVREILNSP